MTAPVLRRLAVLALVASFAWVTVDAVIRPYFFDGPPGDYQVRQGDILLTDGKYDAAIERFAAALEVSPGHRGALMGTAVALMQSQRTEEAEATFTRLISQLERTLQADDPTGRGVLAGAYANRGILRDRQGQHEAALADYRRALGIDAGAVDGPGVIHRILYGNAQASSVRKRADYLERQLALPEDRRLLLVPELDARQRMHKP